MAVLVEGQKLPIASKPDAGKSVVFVKLTDSALRSLEEYFKHRAVLDKNGGSGGPSIHFTPTGGAISLPSASGERGSVFPFGLSANEDGGPNKQSSLACLRNTNSQLETVGTMGETLRVKAGEDAMKRVQQGFDKVAKEKQMNGTVMLDNKGKKDKSKVVRRPTPAAPHRPSINTSSSNSFTSELGPGRGSHVPQRSLSPATSSRPHPALMARSRPSTSPSTQAASWRSPSSAQTAPDLSQHAKTKAGLGGHKSKPGSVANPEIMKRSLRERLVHLLAVRAQKKMELHNRIYKDGMREKDKKSNLLSCLLREVAECKNNVYELKRAMWNDVNEDWPFYSVEDRAALKRRKPQNLTPPGSDTGSTSSGHSPSSTNPASPPQIQCGFKRDRFGDRDEMLTAPPTSKKIRISTYKRPGENRATKSPGLLSTVTHSSPRACLPHLALDTTDSRLDLAAFSGEPCHDDSAPDWAQFQDGEAAATESVSQSPLRSSKSPLRREEGEGSLEQPGEVGGLVALAQNSNKDFLHEFSTIMSPEQRTRYKAVYSESYTKYLQLHKVLESITQKAAALEDQLKRTTRGSPQFKEVKLKIKEEFLRTKTDPGCQEAYSRFQYLHEKLGHVKKLVHNYDQERLGRR